MFKKLVRGDQLGYWILERKFKKEKHSVWDDWYLSSNRPYVWSKDFLKKNGEK